MGNLCAWIALCHHKHGKRHGVQKHVGYGANVLSHMGNYVRPNIRNVCPGHRNMSITEDTACVLFYVDERTTSCVMLVCIYGDMS